MTFGDENRPRPLRFSDVVSTSDDGDQRYGMMTTAMGGEDAAYEMEDANDIVMDGGAGLVGPIGPIGAHPMLPLPPPRGMPPMAAPPHGPMPPHPALQQAWLPDGYSQIFISYLFGPPGFWTIAPLRYAAKFDPFLSLDCAPMPSTLA